MFLRILLLMSRYLAPRTFSNRIEERVCTNISRFKFEISHFIHNYLIVV